MQVVTGEDQGVPLKVWLDSVDDAEPGCISQAKDLTRLSVAHHHVALMPDCHQGFGMPIGGVLATRGAILPNAVGVDIACGMAYQHTTIEAGSLDRSTLQAIAGELMRAIPTGFQHHKEKQKSATLDAAGTRLRGHSTLGKEIDAAYFQLGTMGGGNHFLEVQRADAGHISLMVHSGSRNIGLKVCRYFVDRAKAHCGKGASGVPNPDLAFLPDDTDEGQEYLGWMRLCMGFAKESRALMMRRAMEVLERHVPGVTFGEGLDVHHNYAAQERHFGKEVWVHRKGATRARAGELGIIPGAMGTSSYIVRGLGNPESFESCSHGAGRRVSRTQAKKEHTAQQVLEDLGELGVVIGKQKRSDVAEESRWAYKDIDSVIAQETDLVEVVERLTTLAVVKG